MVIVGVFLYLLIVVSALALLFVPTLRARVHGALARGAGALSGRARKASTAGGRIGRGAAATVAGTARASGRRLHEVRWWWAGALVILLGVPAGALWLRQQHAFDGFDHTLARDGNAQIAALLQGEQLVPPPPLPPELFTTREVESAHPLAASASRQWELLDPDFRQRLLLAYRLMREQHGYEMVLIEGWRSAERQAQLQGLGPHVTHAAPGQSYHQYGLAADSAFLREGRIVISERDPWAAEGYQRFGAVAQSLGLTWGGAWRGLQDLGHVELQRPSVLKRAD